MRVVTGKAYVLLIIFDKEAQTVLMRKRKTEPYKGKWNLLGGKIEVDEQPIDTAYREMEEECGFTYDDVWLKELMSFSWHPIKTTMHVFYGNLSKRKNYVKENEDDEYIWMSVSADFFIEELFAGHGNIGHMIKLLKAWEKEGLL